MRQIGLIVAVLVLAIVSNGCSTFGVESISELFGIDDDVKIEPATFAFDIDNKALEPIEIKFDCNAAWSVVCDAEWCSVSPTSGRGSATLTATVDENLTYNIRTATISIRSATTDLRKSVTITQQGATEVQFADEKFKNIIARSTIYGNSADSNPYEPRADANSDGDISTDEALAVQVIAFDPLKEGVQSLDGIEYFTNLLSLGCAAGATVSKTEGGLSAIDLSKNTKLKRLDCSNNLLEELDVSQNRELTELICSSNRIGSIDITANTLLEKFDCSDNLLTSLNLTNNTKLTTLYCFNNLIVTLEVIATSLYNSAVDCPLDCAPMNDTGGNNLLERLYIAKGRTIKQINGVGTNARNADCIPLQTEIVEGSEQDQFLLSQNQFSVAQLGGSISVTVTSGKSYTIVSMPSWISETTSASTRTLATTTHTFTIEPNNTLTERTGLILFSNSDQTTLSVTVRQNTFEVVVFADPNFKAAVLKSTIYGNNIDSNPDEPKVDSNSDGEITSDEAQNVICVSVDTYTDNIVSLGGIEYFTNISVLYCKGLWSAQQYGGLTELDVSHNTKLESLDCSSNHIASIDVSGCTELTVLSCHFNQLTKIDVSNNKKLIGLDINQNNLTRLDVSQNKYLTHLSCENNQIGSLDVSVNTDLVRLIIDGNMLTEIDISHNPLLTHLFCSRNRLTKLDVSHNSAIEYLYCETNRLTSLDLTNNKEIVYLTCQDNLLTTLDVSTTQLHNYSDRTAANLRCAPMKDDNGDNTLKTLYIATSQVISYINGEGEYARNTEYIPAQTEIVESAGNITFVDSEVERICIANFDTNHDGILTATEAASVSSIGTLFANSIIKSFNELQYFTGLTQIDNGGFQMCRSLTEITLPNTITTLSSVAFFECISLTSITIPDSVTDLVPLYLFSKCINLRTFYGKYASDDNRCLIKDGQLYSFAPAGLTEYDVPENVNVITHSAFAYCDKLERITIPNTVNTISRHAFEGCSSINEFTIPSSVKTIGYDAFGFCSALTTMTIPDTVIELYGAFGGCTNMRAFYGKYATQDNRAQIKDNSLLSVASAGLTEYTVPSGVTSFVSNVFSYCNKLQSITIPEGVTVLENCSFHQCAALTEINLPQSLTTISNNAFQCCTGLEQITIPPAVATIGQYSFVDCLSLKSVYCQPTVPPELGAEVFKNLTDFTVYVPSQSVEAYRQAAEWSNYADSIVGYDF